ncbi:MAG: gamma-glutamyltransferase [Deltaproteobacteria bacterium]|jgi:gamma-glutamyltranspeptidase/glutathione hydrolase|nr:gamma-glutamyltransferase [Deltaproteobacteria bacterium]
MFANERRRPAVLVLAILLLALAMPAVSWAAAYPPLRGGENGMVLSSHRLADAIGQKVLDDGGNAVDAAVAVGYALAVVLPAAGNVGGGGFAIIHNAGKETIALDFREKAPLAATRDMYLDKDGEVVPEASTIGYLAAGVPGTVAGLNAMLAAHGTKPLSEIIAPAIKLAEEGFETNEFGAITMADYAERFARFESTKKYFMKPDGGTYQEGELFVQKDLAEVLKRIAESGDDGFYKGTTAQLIADDMAKNGGLITLADLEQYKVAWREVIKGNYRGYDIVSMSPPSSGGTHLLQILNVMSFADIGAMGFASSETVHLMAEAMRHAYADRSEYMGDPDFVKVPVDRLTSLEYAKQIYDKIVANDKKVTPSSEVKPGLEPVNEGKSTTHYSVVDKNGNAVSVTYTINDWYGSAAAVMGAGFLLNNEMDDFAAKAGVPNIYGLVGSDANCIEPGKRPLSSMSPSLVLKDGKVLLVAGSPGGSRIITTTLQVISNIIDHGMNVSEAVEAPRIHMQWLPDELRVEPFGLVKDVSDKLVEMGYNVSVQDVMGDVNAIWINPETGAVLGSHDPRREF